MTSIWDDVMNDSKNCLAGIKKRDAHLLINGIEKITNHLSLFDCIINECDNVEVNQMLENLSSSLRGLRDLLLETLAEYNAIDTQKSKDVAFHPDLAYELRKLGMPWSKVGQIFGVSYRTMYYWRQKYSISEPNRTISDDDLKSFLLQKVNEHPNAGTGLMHSAVLTAGYRVSKKKVWQCLRSLDSVGVSPRKSKRLVC